MNKLSAFEWLKKLPLGTKLKITAADEQQCEGRVTSSPDPAKVIVFTGKFEWFEFTEQSDVEVMGHLHLHVHG